MATVYVSYRSTEQPFVQAVMARLEPRHDIHIDYKIPVGVDWRGHQLDELRACEVFLAFVSQGTSASDFQNAEFGSARFSSVFLDGKLIIPALIDDVSPPRPLENLDLLDLRHRDMDIAAKEIDDAIARRAPRVRLFVSHAHRDADLAQRLVDCLVAGLDVPDGALRCTSVPGYQLDLGTMAPDALRRELGSSACVVALLTPNSIGNDWVLFELGAAWSNATVSIPLLAGGLQSKDIPGPFRGAAGGPLESQGTLDNLMNQLAKRLGWTQRTDPAARNKQYALTDYAKSKTFARGGLDDELKAGFLAKRAHIGARQGQVLDHIAARSTATAPLTQVQLARDFAQFEPGLFYRLEQLRLLGFIDRINTAGQGSEPVWAWTLSAAYRLEIGR